MIYYTINHYVTTEENNLLKSTAHGDSALCVWESEDYATAPPDHRHDQPTDGWTWRGDTEGWLSHPDVLDQYASNPDEIERIDVWDTSLTDEQ